MMSVIRGLESLLEKFQIINVKYNNNYKFNLSVEAEKVLLNIQQIESLLECVEKIEKIVKEKINNKVLLYFKSLGDNDFDSSKFDSYFSDIFCIEYYGNCYVVSFKENSYLDINFVFDKFGNLIFEGKNVEVLDENNFIGSFCFDDERDKLFDSRELYRSVHYQFVGDKFSLVNCFDDVINIEYNEIFEECNFFDDLVIFSCFDGYMLYDYKNVEKVIPSFSKVTSDLGKFVGVAKDNYMRVIKDIYSVTDYNSVLVSRLEFLVDKSGKIDSFGVSDFDHKCLYSLMDRGKNQEERLESIYAEVRNSCRLDVKRKIRKQN